jgi:methyl-accepting chemotaxis protein
MISDTTNDLGDHLNDLQGKMDRLQAGDVAAIDEVAIEWHALLEEKESTRQGLEMCAQLSTQITHFEASSKEHEQFSEHPSAKKHVKASFGEVRGSIESLIARLQSHEASIDSQLEILSLNEAVSEPIAQQLSRLQQTKESIGQCIKIVSQAHDLASQRSNIFEDITLADNSYAFSVSTINELVTARGLRLKGRSRHFGGQVNNETVQKSMSALTQLDREYIRSGLDDEQEETGFPALAKLKDPNKFQDRFGPGNSL